MGANDAYCFKSSHGNLSDVHGCRGVCCMPCHERTLWVRAERGGEGASAEMSDERISICRRPAETCRSGQVRSPQPSTIMQRWSMRADMSLYTVRCRRDSAT